MERPAARRLVVGGLLTLLCAQLLYAALMLSALYKQYQEPELQVNGLVCKNVADHLSLLVRVGKSLRESTLERCLAPYRERIGVDDGTVAEDVKITDMHGAVLYQWEDAPKGTFAVPGSAKPLFGQLKTFDSDRYFWL